MRVTPGGELNKKLLERLFKAQDHARVMRAKADEASAQADLTRAKIEAMGKTIVYNYNTDPPEVRIEDRPSN